MTMRAAVFRSSQFIPLNCAQSEDKEQFCCTSICPGLSSLRAQWWIHHRVGRGSSPGYRRKCCEPPRAPPTGFEKKMKEGGAEGEISTGEPPLCSILTSPLFVLMFFF